MDNELDWIEYVDKQIETCERLQCVRTHLPRLLDAVEQMTESYEPGTDDRNKADKALHRMREAIENERNKHAPH